MDFMQGMLEQSRRESVDKSKIIELLLPGFKREDTK